jgi:uncharacterized protein involved in response to NO
MIYGFTAAIIGGFVLTAVQNWSGKPGVSGLKLQILFGVWSLARVLLAIDLKPSVGIAAIDLSFFPIVAVYLSPHLRDPEVKVVRVFFGYFILFFVGNLLVHLDALGILVGFAERGLLLGLYTVVLVITLIGGRVIPFFTESSVSKRQPKSRIQIEVLSHGTAIAFLAAQFFAPFSRLAGAVALFAALIHGIRLRGWYVRRIRRVPILWVLHLAYLWIVLGFLLSSLASVGVVQNTLAIHAFTVGGISTIIYGMMTRVSLGHTGRPLRPSRLVVVGYILLGVSSMFRVFGPMLSSGFYEGALLISGGLWIAAFGMFVATYAWILSSPRLDGRDG